MMGPVIQGETAQILALWHRARTTGVKVCLATVVHVEGSSYRKPGARMLVTSDGERAGTISGGCLEAEVSRKTWWLTRNGPIIEQYQSSFDEDGGGIPWGLGCGGAVWILLEQEPHSVLAALETSIGCGEPAVIVSRLSFWGPPGIAQTLEESTHAFAADIQPNQNTVVPSENESQVVLNEAEGPAIPPQVHASNSATETAADRPSTRSSNLGTIAILSASTRAKHLAAAQPPALCRAIETAFSERRSLALDASLQPTTALPACFVEYLAPPPHLTLFGAGDDAQPIAQFASALGWRLTIADGRFNLLRPERFPASSELRLLHYGEASSLGVSPVLCGLNEGPRPPDHAETTTANLSATTTGTETSTPKPGVIPSVDPGLPPQTNSSASLEFAVLLTHSYDQDRALLAALLPQSLDYLGILGPRHRTRRLIGEVAPTLGWTIEACFARLHSPVGLDLGAGDPAAIALAIVAELQATASGREVAVRRQPASSASDKPAQSLAQSRAYGNVRPIS